MRIDDLLRTATADVPVGLSQPPVDAIHGRVHRRRRNTVLIAVSVVLAVAGLGLRMTSHPSSAPPATPGSPVERKLPWDEAIVARDGLSATVYVGGMLCNQHVLGRPQAEVADGVDTVTIAVTATVVNDLPRPPSPSPSCFQADAAQAVVVSLPGPLGSRQLLDAYSADPHPVFFKQYLPEVPATLGWHPVATGWISNRPMWLQIYAGPAGTQLSLGAEPTDKDHPWRSPEPPLPIGSWQGSIVASQPGGWSVWWEVGGNTYSAEIRPAEGGTVTLTEFKQRLAELTWP